MVIHGTFLIERSYSKPPEEVFSAFSELEKKRRWFASDQNRIVEEFKMEFRVGGADRLRFCYPENNRFAGVEFADIGSYQDIVLNQRIVTASTMALGGNRISASLLTFEFLPTEKGTDLISTHQGAFFEGADGPQIREAGWRTLLDRLGAALA